MMHERGGVTLYAIEGVALAFGIGRRYRQRVVAGKSSRARAASVRLQCS